MKNQFELFDQEPTISSDLEWMLKSRQVGNEVLIDTLLAEFYRTVYRLAYVSSFDVEKANQATRQVFVTVLSEMDSYQEEEGIERWFFGIAKRILFKAKNASRVWKHIISVSRDSEDLNTGALSGQLNETDSRILEVYRKIQPEERLVIMAHFGLEWDAERIANNFGIRDDRVEEILHDWHEKIQAIMGDDSGQNLTMLVEKITNDLLERLSPADRDEDRVKSTRQAIISASQRKEKIMWGVRGVREIGFLVGMLLITLVVVWMQIPRSTESQSDFNPGESSSSISAVGEDDTRGTSTPIPSVVSPPSPADAPALRRDGDQEPDFTPTPSGVIYSVEFGDTLDSVAEKLNVQVEELRRINRIAAGEDLDLRDFLLMPQAVSEERTFTSAGRKSILDLPALDRTASSDEIARFILEGNWATDTFWLDVLAVVSGFEGTSGSSGPEPYRIQLWMSPNRALIVSGAAVGDPEQAIIRVNKELFVAVPGEDKPWYRNIAEEQGGRIPDYRYMAVFQLLFPFDLDNMQDVKLRIAGEEVVAGRESWVVERLTDDGERTSLLWVDKKRGWVLGFRVTDPPFILEPDTKSDVRVREIMALNIAYDVDFPAQLIDPNIPWVGGYAQDHTGSPIPADHIQKTWNVLGAGNELTESLPPAGFDPSKAELSFRFPLSYRLANYFSETDIFADEYYLGQSDIGIPWNIWCQRSPDGELIAFIDPWQSEPDRNPVSYSGPYWFSLFNPQEVHEALPSAVRVSSYFAFSPDSRYLAFWGCQSGLDNCGVYLHDTKTLKNRQLLKLTHGATYFVWSPDGEYLAMLGANNSFFVIRVENGEIVYKGPYERQVQSVPPDAPVYRWGFDFPPKMGSLESCSEPPS